MALTPAGQLQKSPPVTATQQLDIRPSLWAKTTKITLVASDSELGTHPCLDFRFPCPHKKAATCVWLTGLQS